LGWGKKIGELLFNRYRFSALQNEKVIRIGDDDGHTTI
jgi:hypothetical protein